MLTDTCVAVWVFFIIMIWFLWTFAELFRVVPAIDRTGSENDNNQKKQKQKINPKTNPNTSKLALIWLRMHSKKTKFREGLVSQFCFWNLSGQNVCSFNWCYLLCDRKSLVIRYHGHNRLYVLPFTQTLVLLHDTL